MPALLVLASANNLPVHAEDSRLMALGFLGVVGVVGGLLALLRTHAPWAATVMLAGAMVGGVSLASADNASTQSRSHTEALVGSSSPVQIGQALFLAKGCVMCHPHAAVSEARKNFDDFRIGPDLTHYSSEYSALFKWLNNPSEVKPSTEMPTLGLSNDEIDALIAFLNAGS